MDIICFGIGGQSWIECVRCGNKCYFKLALEGCRTVSRSYSAVGTPLVGCWRSSANGMDNFIATVEEGSLK